MKNFLIIIVTAVVATVISVFITNKDEFYNAYYEKQIEVACKDLEECVEESLEEEEDWIKRNTRYEVRYDKLGTGVYDVTVSFQYEMEDTFEYHVIYNVEHDEILDEYSYGHGGIYEEIVFQPEFI